jgi:hypothetical protein
MAKNNMQGIFLICRSKSIQKVEGGRLKVESWGSLLISRLTLAGKLR